MEQTFALYLAVILGIVSLAILALLVYLILNPTHNLFDKIGKFFTRRSEHIQSKSLDKGKKE